MVVSSHVPYRRSRSDSHHDRVHCKDGARVRAGRASVVDEVGNARTATTWCSTTRQTTPSPTWHRRTASSPTHPHGLFSIPRARLQYSNPTTSLSNSPPSLQHLSSSPTTFPTSSSLIAVFVHPPRGDDEGPGGRGTRGSRDRPRPGPPRCNGTRTPHASPIAPARRARCCTRQRGQHIDHR